MRRRRAESLSLRFCCCRLFIKPFVFFVLTYLGGDRLYGRRFGGPSSLMRCVYSRVVFSEADSLSSLLATASKIGSNVFVAYPLAMRRRKNVLVISS